MEQPLLLPEGAKVAGKSIITRHNSGDYSHGAAVSAPSALQTDKRLATVGPERDQHFNPGVHAKPAPGWEPGLMSGHSDQSASIDGAEYVPPDEAVQHIVSSSHDIHAASDRLPTHRRGPPPGWPSLPAFELACTFVSDALEKRDTDYRHDAASLQVRAAYLYPAWQWIVYLAALAHLAITAVEPTSHRSPRESDILKAHGDIRTGWIEAILLALYLIDNLLQARFMGPVTFLRSYRAIEIPVWVLCAADVFLRSVGASDTQFSRPLRPWFFLGRESGVRFLFFAVFHALPGMVPIFALLGLLVAVGASLGSTALSAAAVPDAFGHLAANLSHSPPHCSSFTGAKGGCDDYFYSPGSGAYQLTLLLSKTSWPGTMMPFYSAEPWTAVFFVGFLLVGHFFLLRVLLATATTDFKRYCQHEFRIGQRKQRLAFASAFHLVSYCGFVTRGAWAQLVQRVRPDGGLPPGAARAMFIAAGGLHGLLGRAGFLAACELLDLEARRFDGSNGSTDQRLLITGSESEGGIGGSSGVDGPSEALRPPSPSPSPSLTKVCCIFDAGSLTGRWLARTAAQGALLFRSLWVQRATGVMVMLGIVVEVFQSQAVGAAALTARHTVRDDWHSLDEIAHGWVHGISILLTVFFVLDAATKALCFGLERYLRLLEDRLDLFAAVCCVTAEVIELSAGVVEASSDHENTLPRLVLAFRFAMLLRVSRYFRLVRFLKPFETQLNTLGIIAPLLFLIVQVLGCVMFAFAVLGMELFDRALDPSTPGIEGTAYASGNLFPISFNGFGRALVLQFELLMVGKSPLFLEAAMAAEDSWWPALYFGAFYVLGVLVLLSTMVALLIQSFMTLFQQQAKRKSGLVQAWEHALCEAQVQIYAEVQNRHAFPQPITWRFYRPLRLKQLEDALFGEGLLVGFEKKGLRVVDEFDAVQYAKQVAVDCGALPQSGRQTWHRHGGKSPSTKSDSTHVVGGNFLHSMTEFMRSPYAKLVQDPDALSREQDMQALEDDLKPDGGSSAASNRRGSAESINGPTPAAMSVGTPTPAAAPSPSRRLALAQVGLIAHSVDDISAVGSKTLRKLISAAKTSLGMFGDSRSRASSQIGIPAVAREHADPGETDSDAVAAERARHAAVLARARRARQMAQERPWYHALHWNCALGGCCEARRYCCGCTHAVWDSFVYVACATVRGEPQVKEELGLSIGSASGGVRGGRQGQREKQKGGQSAYGFEGGTAGGQKAKDVPLQLPNGRDLDRVKGLRRAALRLRNDTLQSRRAQRVWGVLRARLSEALEVYRAKRETERRRARELWALLRKHLDEAVETYFRTRGAGAGRMDHHLVDSEQHNGLAAPELAGDDSAASTNEVNEAAGGAAGGSSRRQIDRRQTLSHVQRRRSRRQAGMQEGLGDGGGVYLAADPNERLSQLVTMMQDLAQSNRGRDPGGGQRGMTGAGDSSSRGRDPGSGNGHSSVPHVILPSARRDRMALLVHMLEHEAQGGR